MKTLAKVEANGKTLHIYERVPGVFAMDIDAPALGAHASLDITRDELALFGHGFLLANHRG